MNSSRSNLGDFEDQSHKSGSQVVSGKFKRGASNTNQSSHHSVSGYNYTDRVIAKIVTEMMQMSAQYFYSQVQTKEKIDKIDDVIKFAQNSFEIRTYR